MFKTLPLLALVLVCLTAALGCAHPAPDSEDLETARVAMEIRALLAAQPMPVRLAPAPKDGRRASSPEALRQLYGRRGLPIWSRGERVLPAAEQLLASLAASSAEGFDETSYATGDLRSHLAALGGGESGPLPAGSPVRARALAELDLLLTRAYLAYGGHLLAGRVDPRRAGLEWHTERRRCDLASRLLAAVHNGAVAETLGALSPPHSGYVALRRALAAYRELEARGGWPQVPEEAAVGGKQTTPPAALALLRARLVAGGDLAGDAAGDVAVAPADTTLAEAVRRFQRRHGLAATGKVDPATLAQMNVPVAERIRQIELNLERWRWLPQELGQRHLLINIPGFSLAVVEGGVEVGGMRVVVGKPSQQTPVFSDTITTLELNPFWNVPAGIVANEILPALREDPDYLRREGMEVLAGWSGESAPLAAEGLDWSAPASRRLRIRQRPGSRNALGQVKFLFPNRFSVYLHDTPADHLFARVERGFSHGCVRVERPLDLAAYLLRSDPAWSRERVEREISSGARRAVRLPEPVPIHILYWTAWVDEEGQLQFRKDLYGVDRKLAKALAAASDATSA